MNIKEKLALIEEALDVEENTLTVDTKLDDIDEWDSMSALSLIVMLDDEFDVVVTAGQIKALQTIEDIVKYME